MSDLSSNLPANSILRTSVHSVQWKILDEQRGKLRIATGDLFDKKAISHEEKKADHLKTKFDLMGENAKGYCIYQIIYGFLTDDEFMSCLCEELKKQQNTDKKTDKEDIRNTLSTLLLELRKKDFSQINHYEVNSMFSTIIDQVKNLKEINDKKVQKFFNIVNYFDSTIDTQALNFIFIRNRLSKDSNLKKAVAAFSYKVLDKKENEENKELGEAADKIIHEMGKEPGETLVKQLTACVGTRKVWGSRFHRNWPDSAYAFYRTLGFKPEDFTYKDTNKSKNDPTELKNKKKFQNEVSDEVTKRWNEGKFKIHNYYSQSNILTTVDFKGIENAGKNLLKCMENLENLQIHNPMILDSEPVIPQETVVRSSPSSTSVSSTSSSHESESGSPVSTTAVSRSPFDETPPASPTKTTVNGSRSSSQESLNISPSSHSKLITAQTDLQRKLQQELKIKQEKLKNNSNSQQKIVNQDPQQIENQNPSKILHHDLMPLCKTLINFGHISTKINLFLKHSNDELEDKYMELDTERKKIKDKKPGELSDAEYTSLEETTSQYLTLLLSNLETISELPSFKNSFVDFSLIKFEFNKKYYELSKKGFRDLFLDNISQMPNDANKINLYLTNNASKIIRIVSTDVPSGTNNRTKKILNAEVWVVDENNEEKLEEAKTRELKPSSWESTIV